jgi:anthranilate phosphoribosyltransferase
MLDKFITKIKNGTDLTREEASECVSMLFKEQCAEDQIIDLLDSLINKGESIDEISGFAEELMRNCSKVQIDKEAVDLCGTGGSGLERFNVSTTVAFVLGSGGYPVAKHGNKGSKQPNGAFDLLEELGIDFNTTPEREAELFKEFNLCFLFARTHHPAMKAVGPARAKLGKRSIFNIVGPLSNPAAVSNQIVGVSNEKHGPLLINALKKLGKKRALVVYGAPGIDEFSISGDSKYWFLENGEISENTFRLEHHNLKSVDYAELPHGDCKTNAEIFKKLLEGESCEGLNDMVALNAGAAIYTLGETDSIESGFVLAKELIQSGKTKKFFEAYPKI